jgi:outer membrane protein
MQSKENLLPSISGDISRQLSQGRGINPVTNTYVNQSLTSDNYGVTASVTLFNGLALQNSIKQTSLSYQAGKMDFQAAKDIVTIGIITIYLSILDNQEILSQSKSQLAVAQENVDRSETLEKSGANKVASDLSDFKGALAGSQVAVVNSQNSLDASKLNLFQLLNIPYNPNVQFQSLNAQDLVGQYGVSPDQVYAAALEQLAQVKAATLRRESAEKAVKVARGQLLPSLAINSGLSTNYSSAAQNAGQPIGYNDQFKNNYGTYLTLGLNIPIFTNYFRRNNVAQAKVNLESYQNIEDNTKVQLKQNVEQAYYNMAAAYKKYQALSQQVNAYTESIRISKIRFDAGVLNSVDYIIAKNNVDAANLNLIAARYDYFIYSKILDYYQGKLSW